LGRQSDSLVGRVVHSLVMAVDLTLVRHALTVARDAEFASLELEAPNLKFRAELGRGARKVKAAVEQGAGGESAGDSSVVKSLLVGYFGAGPTPLKVGSQVAIGDVVGIVTALGIPNEILSEVNGVVDKVLVAAGDPVEYGQPLVKVKPE
jgi:biotin carboxyl carrier protein